MLEAQMLIVSFPFLLGVATSCWKEMAQELRALSALGQDPRLVLSTQVEELTIFSNSYSRDLTPTFAHGRQTYSHIQIKIVPLK